GLMDMSLDSLSSNSAPPSTPAPTPSPLGRDDSVQNSASGSSRPAAAVILACKSERYFGPILDHLGCPALVATAGFMVPEAYTLDAVIRSWAQGEPAQQVRYSAAAAYAQYQRCPPTAAQKLFRAGA